MEAVIIGVDPRKVSVTIEVRDRREVLRATGRFPTDNGDHGRGAADVVRVSSQRAETSQE